MIWEVCWALLMANTVCAADKEESDAGAETMTVRSTSLLQILHRPLGKTYDVRKFGDSFGEGNRFRAVAYKAKEERDAANGIRVDCSELHVFDQKFGRTYILIMNREIDLTNPENWKKE